MEEPRRYTFREILEECYDIQLELADICESHEILVSDIELVVDEINEHIERVRDHMDMVEKAFLNYCSRARTEEPAEEPEDIPFP